MPGPSSRGDGSLRIAIVGSGPAGFYAAGQLLTADPGARVDMYDRLATPWGLVRAGVAPDHPKIKSVTRIYEKTAALPGFHFHGNVEIGTDLSHDALAAAHHAVLYAVGAPTDRRLGIAGEDLPGSHAATRFVAWYNGHPDHADEAFDLSVRRAVVVGNGNVALDVARMLALTPEELAGTDTADHALAELAASAIEEIVVLGRRGPAQAAFTTPEVRELGALAGADVVVEPAEVALDPLSAALVEGDAGARRNMELLQEYAARTPAGKRKRLVLRFGCSPVALLGDERVAAIRLERNALVEGAGGRIAAQPTGVFEELPAGLVLRSIGYRGTPIPGVPFDESAGTISNDAGRVTSAGRHVPGLYTAGWIKRGPSGVIGTNKKCAQETVGHLLADAAAGRLGAPASEPETLLAELRERGVPVVNYEGWELIDGHERDAGAAQGRPRVKLVRRDELLARAGA